MDIRFAPHNLHLESPDQFTSQDPHLKVLGRQALVWDFPLIQRLPVKCPGIYTISGGRQIGKTTLLKQWMAHLLKSGVHPQAIAFFSGERKPGCALPAEEEWPTRSISRFFPLVSTRWSPSARP